MFITRKRAAAILGATSLLLFAQAHAWQTETAESTRTLNNGNLVLENIPEIPARIGEQLNRFQNVRSAAFRNFTSDGDAFISALGLVMLRKSIK